MRTIARFAMEKRWLVIVGWIAFIALVQGLSGGLGGANYKDTFSLPHTETDKVTHLLDKAGQSDQNGISGQVVLHAKSGTLDKEPAGLQDALAGLCADKLDVVGANTPWQSVKCVGGTAQNAPGVPTLLGTTDKAARTKLIEEIQAKVAADLSTLPLLQGAQVAVVGKSVSGAEKTLDPSFKFRYAALSKG